MKFQDLSEDDIRSIFSFCDIYAVVSMSRTNRYFRRLSLDKLVWVDLVENIRRKGFVDQLSLSDILSYSQEALVALVKSLLTGPACWNPIEPKRKWFRVTNSLPTQTLAEMSAKYVIHPSGIVYSKKREAKLLNGGEYVLFNNITLECWSIRHDKLIWAYDKNGLEWSVCEFAAEVVDGGDSVNIIFWERLWTGGADDQSSLAHIVNLDLKTGSSTGLLRIECSDPQFYGFTDVRICGDIASAAFQDWRSDHSTSTHHCNSYCILMNWRAKSQLKLAVKDFATESPFLVALIPDHVLFLANNASGGPEINVINSTALSSHWRYVADNPTLDTVYTSQVQAIIRESITFHKCARFQGPFRRELCAYESPLEEGTYRIWMTLGGYVPYSRSSLKPNTVICSYRLSLPKRTGDRTTWQQRTAASANPNRNVSGISYSGHSIGYSFNGRNSIFAPGGPTQGAELNLTHDKILSYPHISTYSGALTSLTSLASPISNNQVFILYYK